MEKHHSNTFKAKLIGRQNQLTPGWLIFNDSVCYFYPRKGAIRVNQPLVAATIKSTQSKQVLLRDNFGLLRYHTLFTEVILTIWASIFFERFDSRTITINFSQNTGETYKILLKNTTQANLNHLNEQLKASGFSKVKWQTADNAVDLKGNTNASKK